jgi:type II secretory pathway pseudopilin PulG
MSPRPRTASEGFVLVEILVALSVVAVMAAMMAGVFGQLRSVASIREQLLVRAELEGALSHLERSLGGARLARLAGSKDDEAKMFDGASARVRFATVTRQGFYSLALRDVDIHIDTQGQGSRLVETLSLRRPADTLPEPSTIIILDRFDSIRFAYSDDGVTFTPSFSRDGGLPLMVRITLSRSVAGRLVTATTVARIL